MPKDVCLKFSDEAESMWNQLDNYSKDLSLSSNWSKLQRPKCKPSLKATKLPSDKFTVSKLHELLESLE